MTADQPFGLNEVEFSWDELAYWWPKGKSVECAAANVDGSVGAIS